MRIELYLSIAVLLSCFSCEQSQGERFRYTYQVIQVGDSLAWASPNYNANAWEHYLEQDSIPGVFWTRSWVEVPATKEPRTGYGLQVVATASYDAYWDGHYIGTNGVLAQDQLGEEYGTYHWFVPLPDSLVQAGDHLLALRSTRTVIAPEQHSYFTFDEYFTLTRGPLQVSKYMFLLGGVFLVAALYFFLLYLGQPREYSMLLFSIICLIFLSILLFEYLKLFHLYEYPFQRTRLEIIGYLHLAGGILIPSFFMFHFDFPWKKSLYAVMFAILLFLELNYHTAFDWIARQHTLMLWFLSMVVVIYAVYQRKEGALAVIIGLLGCLLIMKFTPELEAPYVADYDVSLFLSFGLLALTMIYIMIRKRRQELLAYQESLVRSERLKNELLKKNIRPHFIMNTLTSLMDWVEESPQEGVQFIQALADEFELLNEMADFQQIPIEQEIDLCKNHLKVMGYRKEVHYEWSQEGIDPLEVIPPALLHTAVENGVTHSLPDQDGRILFHLEFERTAKYKCYRLTTHARNRKRSSSVGDHSRNSGTGLKYMRSRLQESYPDRWEVKSEATQTGWETTFTIHSKVLSRPLSL